MPGCCGAADSGRIAAELYRPIQTDHVSRRKADHPIPSGGSVALPPALRAVVGIVDVIDIHGLDADREPLGAVPNGGQGALAESPADSSKTRSPGFMSDSIGALTSEEKEQVNDLRQRDQQVRAHESAHLATAGPYALGSASYIYQIGPDGRQYAIGGEVRIDTAPVPGDPEATLRKAQTVRAAALAPSDPSGQDQNVAAQAAALEARARAELARQVSQLENPTMASSPVNPTASGGAVLGEIKPDHADAAFLTGQVNLSYAPRRGADSFSTVV